MKPIILSRAALGLFLALGTTAGAQTPAARTSDKAAAYYHYSLGHMYADLAQIYAGRAEYINKAIDNYRLALKDDPEATFLADELADMYLQSGRIREGVNDAEDALKKNPSDINSRRILARLYTRMIGDGQQRGVDETMLRKAIEQYQKIVERDPKDLDVWLMLGRLHKVAQNSPESEKAYKKALEIDASNDDAMTGLALVYRDLGDNKAAADLLQKVAEKNPSARSLSVLAGTYEQMHEYGLAAETLRRALEMNPSNAGDIKRALAQNLFLSEQLEASLKIYKELVEEEPRDLESLLRISQIYRQQRNFEKAREASNKAKELDANNLEIRYNEINLLEAEGKIAEAIDFLKQLLTSSAKRNYNAAERGNRVLLLERLGLLYRGVEQFSNAVDTFRQMADLDPDVGPRAAAQIVDTLRMGKDFGKAEQEADAAYKKYPGDRTIRAVRASVLADVGKVDAAAADLRKLLDGKNDRETYVSLAQIYEKGKKYDEMSQAIDAAEKLSQTKEEKEGIVFMRAAMLERMKKYDQAEAEFRRVLQFNPESAAALNYLGYMLADRNVRLQEALQLITKAVEREPHNGAYLDSLGWVYFRLGRLPEAEDYLRRSLDRISRDPTVHDHLGDVYLRQGKLKEAIAQWQMSLKEWDSSAPADHDTAEVAKVRTKLEGAKVRLAKEGGSVPQQQR